jgi:hypothetical protein
MKKLLCILSLSVLGLVGCSTSSQRPLYSWGSFPQQMYLTLSEPAKALPESQIQLLEKDIEMAKAKNLAIPPGLYAHLGMLYLESHQSTRAADYFELEKQAYPESTVLMNRLLQTNNTGTQKVIKE